MNDDLGEVHLVLGTRAIGDVRDRIRRYCGLRWSGGEPEAWAFRYYDAIETDSDHLEPIDVVAAAAVHPGLSRADLAYFFSHSTEIDDWLAAVPRDVLLGRADDALVDHIADLATWPDEPTLTLLTKVLHRKRPEVIPLVDRHVLDWYRPITGERSARAAWPQLIRALREDLGGPNEERLARLSTDLELELGRSVSHLRLVDIALWMGAQA